MAAADFLRLGGGLPRNDEDLFFGI